MTFQKVALIVPTPDLPMVRGRKFHLTLSHLMEDEKYRSFYLNESIDGSFIILDNSAHEHEVGQRAEIILTDAIKVRASEIVCTDALFDGERTVELTTAALDYFLAYGEEAFATLKPRLMIVPQGKTIEEYTSCLNGLLKALDDRVGKLQMLGCSGLTFGLSKDYEMFEGGLPKVLGEDILPAIKGLQFELHLLGWGRKLWELIDLFYHFGNQIRSVDSAKPIVYGLSNLELDPTRGFVPPYPKRSKDFFELPIKQSQLLSVWHNISILEGIAQGAFPEVTNDQM